MLAVVVGGAGFIGREVVRQLGERGSQVVIVSRSAGVRRASTADVHSSGVTILQWNGVDAQRPFIDVLRKANAVINLAGHSIGQGWWTAKEKQRILRSRVQTTTRLVHAMDQADCRACLISASAVGYYGCAANALLDEDSPQGSGFLASVCAQWERATFLAKNRRVVVLRLGVVLGRSGGVYPRLSRIGPFCAGPVGSGEQWMPWIHLADAAAMFADAAWDERHQGVFNAVAPRQSTQRQLVKTMARHLDRPQLPAVPAWALRLALGREMADELLLCSQRIAPKRYEETGRTWTYPTLDDAMRDLAQG